MVDFTYLPLFNIVSRYWSSHLQSPNALHILDPGQLPNWRLKSTSETQRYEATELKSVWQRNYRTTIIKNRAAENAKVMEEMEELAVYRYFVFHYFANFC
jgi:hypothetical protein